MTRSELTRSRRRIPMTANTSVAVPGDSVHGTGRRVSVGSSGQWSRRVWGDMVVFLSSGEAASLGGDLLTMPMSELGTEDMTSFATGGG